jgi:hypothetical protein
MARFLPRTTNSNTARNNFFSQLIRAGGRIILASCILKQENWGPGPFYAAFLIDIFNIDSTPAGTELMFA